MVYCCIVSYCQKGFFAVNTNLKQACHRVSDFLIFGFGDFTDFFRLFTGCLFVSGVHESLRLVSPIFG
jgi:hypothetical protein